MSRFISLSSINRTFFAALSFFDHPTQMVEIDHKHYFRGLHDH